MAMNILVIDDSSVTRAMVIKTLKMAGLAIEEIHQAGDGQQGLDILGQLPVDLVLTDLNMPVMDGEEMIERIRQEPKWANLPIIVISTEGSETRVGRIRELGAKFIHKPFTPETVREIVEAFAGVEEGMYNDALAACAEETLMSLAFMFTAFDDEDGPDEDQVASILGSVEFHGPCHGELFVRVPVEMLGELASNMLGLESGEEPADEHKADALKELINVICGNLLPQLAGTEAVFKVAAPQLLGEEDVPTRRNGQPPSGSARLMLDTGPCRLALFVEGTMPSGEEQTPTQPEEADLSF
jgi:two-component system chemotaxis response regulator CheY